MYYVIEIATGDVKIAGKAVYEYATANDAIAAFHGKLSTAMKSNLFDTELIIIIDETGKIIKREKYNKPMSVYTEFEENELG